MLCIFLSINWEMFFFLWSRIHVKTSLLIQVLLFSSYGNIWREKHPPRNIMTKHTHSIKYPSQNWKKVHPTISEFRLKKMKEKKNDFLWTEDTVSAYFWIHITHNRNVVWASNFQFRTESTINKKPEKMCGKKKWFVLKIYS